MICSVNREVFWYPSRVNAQDKAKNALYSVKLPLSVLVSPLMDSTLMVHRVASMGNAIKVNVNWTPVSECVYVYLRVSSIPHLSHH